MMAAGIREEMRRLHRRKQLHFNPNESQLDRESSSDSPGSPSANSFAATYHQSHRDKPLFTFRQYYFSDVGSRFPQCTSRASFGEAKQ
ncbi:Akirin-2 [Homalodisca vitripennis]|nr:Akirin-2 [Homalodisca vitripennis]